MVSVNGAPGTGTAYDSIILNGVAQQGLLYLRKLSLPIDESLDIRQKEYTNGSKNLTDLRI